MSFSFGFPAFPSLSISGCLAYQREPEICGESKSLEETSNIIIKPMLPLRASKETPARG
jgi:hypothetical protein